MEEALARTFQISVAVIGAFSVALWFALIVWTYRDAVSRSRSPGTQIFSTLIVVLFFIPGIVIYLLLRPRETLEEKQQRWVEEEYLAQELEDVDACPSCNHLVRDTWLFCPSCRFQLRRACHSCGRLVDVGWEVCAFCGVELRGSTHRHADVTEQSEEVESPVVPWGETTPPQPAVQEAHETLTRSSSSDEETGELRLRRNVRRETGGSPASESTS